jgi:hypothetical protein
MKDIILNVLPAQGPNMPMWIPLIGGFPINSPLVGSFIGVVLGFAVNYGWKWVGKKRNRLHYINLFNNEFIHCSDILVHDWQEGKFSNPLKANPILALPIDSWMSAVNIGALRLFRPTEVDRLSKIFLKINNYNNTAKMYEDLLIQYSSAIGRDIDELSGFYKPRKRLSDSNIDITHEIEEIKRENWMLTKHWWQFWK